MDSAWVFICRQTRILSSDTDIRGPGEAFYQQLTGALPLNTRSSRSRWRACPRTCQDRDGEKHLKPTLSSAFSNFLLGQQTVPTCANRRHSCLSRHRGGEIKTTMREKETDRVRETWFQHSIREKFSPQFSLLQCQNCCTCRYLLCLTLCLWHKMSALIRQNKFLVNTEGGETADCLFCLLESTEWSRNRE